MNFFTGIIGHEAAKRVLERAVSAPLHGYLIAGPAGTGCHTLAEAFVRALAEYPAEKPLAAHPDIAILAREPNDAGTGLRKEIAVKEVRALRLRISERPALGVRVVAYVPEADYLNVEGVNALLKSIEEPPAGAVFVLVSHAPGKLPATLKSRLQSVTLGRVPHGDIVEWLTASGIPAAEAETAAGIADGRPAIARRYAEDAEYRARVADADAVVRALVDARSSGDAFAAIAAEASRCERTADPVPEWRETLHLWGAALRRRFGEHPAPRAYAVGAAFIRVERHLGGPISPRVALELALTEVVAGRSVSSPTWPTWCGEFGS